MTGVELAPGAAAAPALRLWIGGASVLGPGLPGWEGSRPILAGHAPWREAPVALPPPALLPPTERRRTSLAVRLALAAAAEAAAQSGLPADALDTVFCSSNGDGAVVGAILDTLAAGGDVSPTQFHNSVHNAAAGYWGIGAGSTRGSVSLGCHDDTMPAGLLQAAAGVAAWGRPVLFCAYDAPLPEPLAACRPGTGPFGAALVLTAERCPGSRAALTLRYRTDGTEAPGAAPRSPLRQALEEGNPAARALPLLEAVAAARAARIVWPLLDGAALEAELMPC